jgi:hypothetical protein
MPKRLPKQQMLDPTMTQGTELLMPAYMVKITNQKGGKDGGKRTFIHCFS